MIVMKTIILGFALFATGFLAVEPAFAQDQLCAGAETRVELDECLVHQLRVAETHLEQAYQALRFDLDSGAKGRLLKSQRLWVKFRDAECTRVMDYAGGGTIASTLYLSCMLELTDRRIGDLSINPLTSESN